MIFHLTQLTRLRPIYCCNKGINFYKSLCSKDQPTSAQKFRNYCNQTEGAYKVNTNVVKDVILFKYDNGKFFKFLNIFALCQFGFWGYLSHFAFNHLKDAPVTMEKKSELPWWRRFNLGENKYRNTIAIGSFLVGYGILVIAWMYTLKSVRYLILRRGGNQLTFVCYTPFGQNRIMDVPLRDVSCKEARQAATSQLPLKVRNHYLHYILDMRGEFKNTALFDNTAGLRRTLNK